MRRVAVRAARGTRSAGGPGAHRPRGRPPCRPSSGRNRRPPWGSGGRHGRPPPPRGFAPWGGRGATGDSTRRAILLAQEKSRAPYGPRPPPRRPAGRPSMPHNAPGPARAHAHPGRMAPAPPGSDRPSTWDTETAMNTPPPPSPDGTRRRPATRPLGPSGSLLFRLCPAVQCPHRRTDDRVPPRLTSGF